MRLTKATCKKLHLPCNGATAQVLPQEVVDRLHKAGIASNEWLEFAAMVGCKWETEKKREERKPPRPTRKPLEIDKDDLEAFVESQESFLQYLSTYRALFPTTRDNWDTWLDASGEDLSEDDRAFLRNLHYDHDSQHQ